jgi:hypothetical protein
VCNIRESLPTMANAIHTHFTDYAKGLVWEPVLRTGFFPRKEDEKRRKKHTYICTVTGKGTVYRIRYCWVNGLELFTNDLQ